MLDLVPFNYYTGGMGSVEPYSSLSLRPFVLLPLNRNTDHLFPLSATAWLPQRLR